MVGHLHVGIEQDVILCVHLFKRTVVSFGEPPVLLQHDDAHLGKVHLQNLERVIRRGIVSHIHHGLAAREVEHTGQKTREHLNAVPIQNNNSGLVHIRVLL